MEKHFGEAELKFRKLEAAQKNFPARTTGADKKTRARHETQIQPPDIPETGYHRYGRGEQGYACGLCGSNNCRAPLCPALGNFPRVNMFFKIPRTFKNETPKGYFSMICSRKIFFLFLTSMLLLSACSGVKSSVPPEYSDPGFLTHGRTIADLERFPQRVADFAAHANKKVPLLSAEKQQEEAGQLKKALFNPWRMGTSGLSPKRFAASVTANTRPGFYGRNLLPVSDKERESLASRANIAAFPSMAAHGIVTRETSMRGLPTATPLYLAPWKAGEGYPFDMLQHGILRPGLPVFISHIATDGTWFFCETAWGAGWVPAGAVAITDSAFEEAWKARPLAVITRENALLFSDAPEESSPPSVQGNEKNGLPQDTACLRASTLLPYLQMSPEKVTLLLPVRDARGKAHTMQYHTARENAAPFPLPFTAGTVAMLADQLMDAPYEWGGTYGGRDCSLLTRELLQSMGLFLPVNSARQLASGVPQQIGNLTPEQKIRFIREHAVPFRTLIGFPGHVALYLGEWNNEPAMLHCLWGLRTKNNGQEGRLLVGKVVITSLNPGMEWEDVRAGAPLLPRIKTITVLPHP